MTTQQELEELIQRIRPELHRYASRMVGSVIDGEDVVQEASIKAYGAVASLEHEINLRGWLFRITHNKAIDYLRRNSDTALELLDEYPIAPQPDQPLEEKEIATFALSLFVKLAPRQRSCVIFKDVMGYSLAEISEMLDATVPEIKAALHRGRTRLRELAVKDDSKPSKRNVHEQELLQQYVDRFNARDFETLRTMLTDEVRLELYNRAKLRGADEIAKNYFGGYARAHDWRFAVGEIEGRAAILGYDLEENVTRAAYVILLTWEGERISLIRDFRYARYAMHEVEMRPR